MRRANIYYKEVIAGILTETDDGDYVFQEGGAWMGVVHRGMGAMLSHHTTKQEAIEWLKSHYKEVK